MQQYRREAQPSCTCRLPRTRSFDDTVHLGSGCTHPNYVCPVLDRFQRALLKRGPQEDDNAGQV